MIWDIEKLLRVISEEIIEAIEQSEEDIKNSKYLQPYIFKKLKFNILTIIENRLTAIDIIEGIIELEKEFKEEKNYGMGYNSNSKSKNNTNQRNSPKC